MFWDLPNLITAKLLFCQCADWEAIMSVLKRMLPVLLRFGGVSITQPILDTILWVPITGYV